MTGRATRNSRPCSGQVADVMGTEANSGGGSFPPVQVQLHLQQLITVTSPKWEPREGGSRLSGPA